MPKKPTYEELEQEVKKGKQAEEALWETKQKWMSLVENTNDFILIIDDKGKIQYINRTIPPHTINQVTGKTLYDFAAPEHHEMIRQAVARVFETREQGSYTSSVKHPTGIQWFETTMVPIIEKKKVISAMSFNKIITESKQAEEALRESEERFRQLAEGTFEAIVLHEKGVILEANNQYYEMFGYKPKELTGKDAISLTTSPESARKVREQISLGNLGPYEATGVKKDGTKFPMESRIKLIGYKGRKVRMAAIRDRTERKQGEAALKKRTRELELKRKSLEELNTALKVLLNKREEDKIEVEQNVMTNVRELIAPYFEKINETKLDDYQKTFLNILESNLNEIVSPFTRKLSLKYLSLTPKEIQIVNMIKIGYPSKKIAKIMKISPRTVDSHRKNIRSKIGLGKKKANLRSHFLAHEQ
jgi:PAS domain S-box-containing protein